MTLCGVSVVGCFDCIGFVAAASVCLGVVSVGVFLLEVRFVRFLYSLGFVFGVELVGWFDVEDYGLCGWWLGW